MKKATIFTFITLLIITNCWSQKNININEPNSHTTSVYINSIEKNIDAMLSTKIITPALNKLLVDSAFIITTDSTNANYVIDIDAQTTKGHLVSYESGVSTSFLMLKLEIKKNGVSVFTDKRTIEGWGVGYKDAGISAFKKEKEQLTNLEYINNIMNLIKN